MSEKYEVVCGSCGRPLFFGEVLAAFAMNCGRCGFLMEVPAPREVPSLAEAIVESMKSAPVVNDKGQTVCNCKACRLAGEELRKMGFESSELADAIVASLAIVSVVNDKGQTVCNCDACRNARN